MYFILFDLYNIRKSATIFYFKILKAIASDVALPTSNTNMAISQFLKIETILFLVWQFIAMRRKKKILVQEREGEPFELLNTNLLSHVDLYFKWL